MNFSRLEKRICGYLGIRPTQKTAQTDAAIRGCVAELEKISHFRYIYKLFATPPEFLKKPPYTEYLKGSRGVIVAAMTLGGEVDRRVKFYERADAARAVVLDACAGAYLEELSDEYEKGLGEALSYRFCCGYGGSSTDDLKYIFEILQPEKIGLTLNEKNYMLPSKSMAGVIAVVGGKE